MTKRIYILGLACILLAKPFSFALAQESTAPDSVSMTLAAIYQLADEKSRVIRISEQSLRAAQEGVQQAKNSLLPSVSIDLSGSYISDAYLMSRGFSTSGTTEVILPDTAAVSQEFARLENALSEAAWKSSGWRSTPNVPFASGRYPESMSESSSPFSGWGIKNGKSGNSLRSVSGVSSAMPSGCISIWMSTYLFRNTAWRSSCAGAPMRSWLPPSCGPCTNRSMTWSIFSCRCSSSISSTCTSQAEPDTDSTPRSSSISWRTICPAMALTSPSPLFFLPLGESRRGV